MSQQRAPKRTAKSALIRPDWGGIADVGAISTGAPLCLHVFVFSFGQAPAGSITQLALKRDSRLTRGARRQLLSISSELEAADLLFNSNTCARARARPNQEQLRAHLSGRQKRDRANSTFAGLHWRAPKLRRASFRST